MESTDSCKRRRTSSPTSDAATAKRLQALPRNIYGDTYVSGSADVHLGDRLYFEDRGNALEQEAQRLQSSLYFSGMHGRYEELPEAADSTYAWILSADTDAVPAGRREQAASFSQWFRYGSGTFWVAGKPGSGKSTLMKYLTEHIASENPEVDQPNLVVLSFFFWIKGDDLQRSRTGCMRSLLWQTLQNAFTRKLATQTCHLHFKGVWTENVLRITLSTILRTAEYSVAIFLDGLDESNDHDQVVALLGIFEPISKVKICVSSRPEPVFVDALRSCQALRLQDLNFVDIQQVIKDSFLEDKRVVALAAKLTEEDQKEDLENLSSTIQSKAEGVFLWVHLVIKDLLRGITQKDDLSTLSQRLDRLPNDIYALYKDMLKRTHHDYELYKDKISLFLSLALHRKFNLMEFCFAVNEDLRNRFTSPSIYNTDPSTDLGADVDCEIVMAQVQTYTAGLLVVRDYQQYSRSSILETALDEYPLAGQNPSLLHKLETFKAARVRFVHRTAVDFLQNTSEGISLLATLPCTYDDIKMVCFETSMIYHAILPGILGRSVSLGLGWGLCCLECDDEDMYNALKKQGEYVLASLQLAGLLLPDRSTWVVSERAGSRRVIEPFPSSNHACVDLVPVLINGGRFQAAQMLLDSYECTKDQDYLTAILIIAVRAYLSFTASGFGHASCQDLELFLDALTESHMALSQNLITQIGEIINPVGEALSFASTTCASSEKFLRTCRLLGLAKIDLSMTVLPCCYDCHQVWHVGVSELTFEIWGALCAVNKKFPGMKGELAYSDPPITRSEDDRILVIASNASHRSDRTNAPSLWAVSGEHSQRLIAAIRKPWRGVFCRYSGIYRLSIEGEAGLLDDTQSNSGYKELMATIEAISTESPPLTFATAMKRLGKSQETIQKFYEGEAERMALEHSSRQQGWKEWYWGDEAPPGVNIDPA